MTETSKRINVTIPVSTLRLLDGLAPKGDRSKFLTAAVHTYVQSRGRARLRAALKEGAKARASRDLALAEEWFPLEEELWSGGRKYLPDVRLTRPRGPR